jgi:hypothetical protein
MYIDGEIVPPLVIDTAVLDEAGCALEMARNYINSILCNSAGDVQCHILLHLCAVTC